MRAFLHYTNFCWHQQNWFVILKNYYWCLLNINWFQYVPCSIVILHIGQNLRVVHFWPLPLSLKIHKTCRKLWKSLCCRFVKVYSYNDYTIMNFGGLFVLGLRYIWTEQVFMTTQGYCYSRCSKNSCSCINILVKMTSKP